ncbi:MAG TPA: ABC transporter permease subunit [Candidatus Dormibacteraeota bacterium]|nr:ABC transporter permease subunit [Candidatus Dormibacteraeota bacterium]
MFFRTVFLKTLRDYRVAILGWGIGMGLTIVSPMASVATLISTPQARAQLASLAQQFKWAADPVAAGTVGGYATFKIGIFILLMAVWPLLAGSRMLRGEEITGSLDVLLSVPRTRIQIAVQKVGAMWTALLLMGAIIGLLAYVGGAKFKGEFGFGDAMLFGLNLVLICAVFGAISLFVSQFTQERSTAAGITGGFLIVFIGIDMVHRVIPNTDWFSHLSPVYYYNLNKPLVPGYGVNLGAMLLLAGLTLLLSGAGVWLFARRDLGDVVRIPLVGRLARATPPSKSLPERDWSVRSVYTRGLATLAMPTFWWTLGIAGWAAWLVVIVKQVTSALIQLLNSSANSGKAVKALEALGGSSTRINEVFLGAMFELLPIFLMAFAVTQVNRWAADNDEGRLEIVLATPHPRVEVLLARFAALATATVIIGVVTLLGSAAASAVAGVTVDSGHLAAATLGMIPLGLLMAAVGYLAAGWLRTAADTGLLSFLLAGWFFLSFIGPDLKLPDTTLKLSPFYYYGTPLINGIDLANLAVIVAVAAVSLALASYRFARKDLAA